MTPGFGRMFNCVNYDFQGQIVYNDADDVAPLLPAGSIIHVERTALKRGTANQQ